MKLSIIIGNYNTLELTKSCIESIFKYRPKFSFEVIVVDDASTDNSQKELKNLEKKYSNLKVLFNLKNSGYVRTNNKGLNNSKGEYKLLLNSDTLVQEKSIDNLVEFAEKTPEAGVVGSRLVNIDGTIQESCYDLPTIWNVINYKKFAPKSKEPIVVDAVVGASFLITPKAYKLIGNLSEKYVSYFEDLDYCREVKKKGLKVYYLPTSVITHYHGESFKQLADEKNQWKKLIPSSIAYHGLFKHYILYIISWIYQKLHIFLWLLLVAIFTIPAFWNLLRPGFFPMQDDLQAFRIQQMDKCLDDFQIPCRWVPDAGYQYGYPQFNFYPPLPYYLGAVLHRVGLQYIDAVKALFILGYVLSAVVMYLLIKNLTDTWSGLIGALLYTYIPYKAVEVYVRGALNEFWAQIFFPLIFWSSYKLIKSGKTRYLIWLAVSLVMLATTHLLMAMVFAPIFIVWVLFWLGQNKWKNLLRLFTGGFLGFCLSAFFVLPVAFERKFVHVESLLSGYFDYRQHFVSLQKLFLSMEWGYGSSGFPNEKLNLSLGIIHWVVGLLIAPVLALVLYKKKKKLSILVFVFSILSLFTIFMMHLRSSFIWSRIPILAWLQFPWRILAISIFLLTLTVGLAICLSGKFKYVLGISFVLIAFILYFPFFIPKDWLAISDSDKFSGINWEKQLTISIFDYLPIYATLPPWSKAPELPEVLEGEAQFLEYRKRSNFQTGIARVSGEALIRLPLFDFPGMVVQIDGQEVPHWNNDCRGQRYCLGLITFNLENGTHTILAKLYDTPIRRVGNIITLGGIGVLVFLVIKSRR